MICRDLSCHHVVDACIRFGFRLGLSLLLFLCLLLRLFSLLLCFCFGFNACLFLCLNARFFSLLPRLFLGASYTLLLLCKAGIEIGDLFGQRGQFLLGAFQHFLKADTLCIKRL